MKYTFTNYLLYYFFQNDYLDQGRYQQKYRIDQQNGDMSIGLQRQLLLDLAYDHNDYFQRKHWDTFVYSEENFNTGSF